MSMRRFVTKTINQLIPFSFLIYSLSGCAGVQPLNLPEPKQVHRISDAFKTSIAEKYAIVIKGEYFKPKPDQIALRNVDDVVSGQQILDTYINNDVDQISRLALAKGYQVYLAEMGRDSVKDIFDKLDSIAIASSDKTQLFIAYSGEGDAKGWITCASMVGRWITFAECRIKPSDLFKKLEDIRGTKAILINACESGCMAEEAQKNPAFRGVVIAACAVGYATTPNEPSNLTAIYAAFLKHYVDDPAIIKNLATLEITRAGSWWTNFRHHVSDIGAGGLPISYSPVIYSNFNFLF